MQEKEIRDGGDYAIGHYLTCGQQVLGAGHRQDERAQVLAPDSGVTGHCWVELELPAQEPLALRIRVQRADPAPERRLDRGVAQ